MRRRGLRTLQLFFFSRSTRRREAESKTDHGQTEEGGGRGEMLRGSGQNGTIARPHIISLLKVEKARRRRGRKRRAESSENGTRLRARARIVAAFRGRNQTPGREEKRKKYIYERIG